MTKNKHNVYSQKHIKYTSISKNIKICIIVHRYFEKLPERNTIKES